jgi:hypothetical protein
MCQGGVPFEASPPPPTPFRSYLTLNHFNPQATNMPGLMKRIMKVFMPSLFVAEHFLPIA